MEQIIGQMIDRYRLERLLGQGVLGNVYQGHDTNLERVVALKVIKPELTGMAGFAALFVPAVRALGRLEQRGLVRVLDFGHTEQRSYIVMEYIESRTMAQLLAAMQSKQQWLTLPAALHMVQQLAQTVDYLQRQGAPQRRILPGKLTFKVRQESTAPLAESPQPVLMDLGLQSVLAPLLGLTRRLSHEGLAYLSPEEVLGDATDQRSDVYTLGAWAFELTTGQPCLAAQTLGEAIDAHINRKMVQARAIHPALPEPLAAIIEKALARTPADRYATASAFLDALTPFMADQVASLLPPCATHGMTTLQAQLAQPVQRENSTPREAQKGEESGLAATMVTGAAPALVTVDQLKIQPPKGEAQSIPLEKTSLTIGRTPDNDLILDDPRVSRKHARLELDNNCWQVVDLNSANGIFIAKTRLPPGSTRTLEYDTPVRIGDHYLRIIQEAQEKRPEPAPPPVIQPARTIFIKSIGAAVDHSHILSSADRMSVGLFLAETKYNVEPGHRLAIPIILINEKTIADAYLLAVKGAPAAWLRLPTTRIELAPGEQRQVILEVEPARQPQTKAQNYTIRLDVASQNMPGQSARGDIKLTVRRYVQFQVELKPQSVSVGEPIQISIVNQGNTLQLFTLAWWDERQELIFEPKEGKLEIAPGEIGVAKFTAVVRKPRLLGAAHPHPIKVQVSPHYAKIELYQAEVISRGRIPIG